MADLRSAMIARGFAADVVNHALKRWNNQQDSQDSYWWHWKRSCAEKGCNPLSDDPMQVAGLLAKYEVTHGFKFIEKLKVAISTFMELLYDHSERERIALHPLIKSQLAGSRKTKPSQPRHAADEDAWDIGLILKYWTEQPPDAELTIKDLGHKLVSLWLSCSSSRVSDLAHLCRDTITFPCDGRAVITAVRFQYWFTKELARPVRTRFMLIPVGPEERCCVVHTLQRYLQATSDSHRFQHFLQQKGKYMAIDMSQAPPLVVMTCHKGRQQWPLGAERISSWMQNIMQLAGVPSKYTGGSGRMASASFLLDSGFTLEYVLGLGRWQSMTIFKRHYDRSKKANLGLSAQAE